MSEGSVLVMRRIDRSGSAGLFLGCLLLISLILLSACGSSATGADCTGNVAVVDGTAITNIQYGSLLRYTLGFYEHGNTNSRYYGKLICQAPKFKSDCSSIKKQLQQHMIDQAVVSNYAAAHNLIATPGDWTKALARERKLIQAAGGNLAFLAYLRKLGTDEAQFRFLESEQIETGKVIRAVGVSRFKPWLSTQEQRQPVTRCPLS